MKRYRLKTVGLGLALWAGYLHGQDAPPGTSGSTEWSASPAASATVWLPARPPAPAAAPKTPPPASPTAVVIPAIPAVPIPAIPQPGGSKVIPAAAPGPTFLPLNPAAISISAIGDRTGDSHHSSLPVAPPLKASAVAGANTSSQFAGPMVEIPLPPVASTAPAAAPNLPPAAVSHAAPGPYPLSELPAIPTAIPVNQPADPLPQPRQVPPPIPPAKELPEPVRPVRPIGELPTAPPELMIPPGVPVPGKHGTFGSSAVNISTDYPSVRELMDRDGEGWWEKFRLRPRFESSDPANAAPPVLAADRLQLYAEFLLWWVNTQHIPLLATTSVNGGFGFLGSPGTAALLGPGNFGNSLRPGMRVGAGYWFDDCGTWGINGSYFFLAKQTTTQSFDSAATPTITRPIFAPNFPGEFGEIVAMPGLSSGTLVVQSASNLWGFDANLRRALCKTCDYRSEIFAGYRFLGLNESLSINEFITALPGNPSDPAGTRVSVSDNFQTRNRFNGGQVGYAAERIWGRFSASGRASVALGDTTETLDISGSQARLRPGMLAPDTFAGGLLATGPNLGHFTRDRFSVVPELTLNAGYWLTPVLKAYVGYNFLYWSNVLRPGDQIDRTVDVTFVPNPPPGVPFSGQNRPQPTFQQSHLFVNGIQFGLMGRW
jgi:hypothetical protein